MPTVHHVKKARKNNKPAGIKKGQEYWWAGYRLGYSSHKRFWKSPPRMSQVAASEYISNVLSIEEEMMDATPEDASDLETMREEWADRIREIADDAWHGDVREGVVDALNDDGSADIRIGETVRAERDRDGNWIAVERY